MKTPKLLTILAVAAAFLASSFQAQAGCCADAKKARKPCAHECCVKAAKAKKSCEKCNPKKTAEAKVKAKKD